MGEGVFDAHGKPVTSLKIKKGQDLHISMYGFNHSKDLFGEDAANWRPERWLDGTLDMEKLTAKAGFVTWGHTLTFFAGARGCIGYRFAVLEMKARDPHPAVDDV